MPERKVREGAREVVEVARNFREVVEETTKVREGVRDVVEKAKKSQ